MDSDSDHCPGVHVHDDFRHFSDIESHFSGGNDLDMHFFPKLEKKASAISSSHIPCESDFHMGNNFPTRAWPQDQNCSGSSGRSEGLDCSILSVRDALKDGTLTKRSDHRHEIEPKRNKKLKREHPESKSYNLCQKCVD